MPPAAPAPDNPLTNLKVRQAIWHAINRQEIADKLVHGGSRVPPAPCFPTPVRLRRRRRGEVRLRSGQGQGAAGRGGLSQRLRRRVRDLRAAAVGAAVQNYLQAVGIRAKINQLQVAPAIQRAHGGRGAALSSAAGAATRSTTCRRSCRLLRRRRRRLRAGSRAREAGGRGRPTHPIRRRARRPIRPRSSA